MSTITTIGLDLAKNVFQVRGIEPTGRIGLRRKQRRAEMSKFLALFANRIGLVYGFGNVGGLGDGAEGISGLAAGEWKKSSEH